MGNVNPQTTKSSQTLTKLGGVSNQNIKNNTNNRIQTAKQQYSSSGKQNFLGTKAHQSRAETANTSNLTKLPNASSTAAQRRAKLQNLGNHLKQVAGSSSFIKQKQYVPLRS